MTLVDDPAPSPFEIAVYAGPPYDDLDAETSASVTYGSVSTLAVLGLPSGAVGSVTFRSGETSLCTATLPALTCTTPPMLAAGSYDPITATFADDDGNHSGSTSTNTAALTVEKTAVTITGEWADDAAATASTPATDVIPTGSTAVLRAVGIPFGPTGTVTFSSGGTVLCMAVLPAVSCTTAAGLPAGDYRDIVAGFADTDGNYQSSSLDASLSLVVTAPSGGQPPAPVIPGATQVHTGAPFAGSTRYVLVVMLMGLYCMALGYRRRSRA